MKTTFEEAIKLCKQGYRIKNLSDGSCIALSEDKKLFREFSKDSDNFWSHRSLFLSVKDISTEWEVLDYKKPGLDLLELAKEVETALDSTTSQKWIDAKSKMENSRFEFRAKLNSMSEEEFTYHREKFFVDSTPKGWVSIEEKLPMMYAKDIAQSYTPFKVKDKEGREFVTKVSDHTMWYHEIAIPQNITHWFNQ